jgi:hypothetical protein
MVAALRMKLKSEHAVERYGCASPNMQNQFAICYE